MIIQKNIPGDSQKDLLKMAERRIFSLGLDDLTARLSYKNMSFALAKIMHILDDHRAFSVFAPDATITRNKPRWLAGFGYGAVIRWSQEDVTFPDIRPNGCGMLLMRVDDLPSKEELVERASSVNAEDLSLEGLDIQPDFGKGNHFFEFYEPVDVSDESDLSEDSYYAIIHGSAQELKDNMYGWSEKGEREETPVGGLNVLRGDKAEKYFEDWKRLASFSKKRREFLAEQVIGDHEVLSNYNHQGFCAPNEVRLGCYNSMEQEDGDLFPVTLRWDQPTFVFEGRQNISKNVMKKLGFLERAKELDLFEDLLNINILPHGGGYEIKLPYNDFEVTTTEFGNVYTLKMDSSQKNELEEDKDLSEMAITNPSSLPYSYRGIEVVERTLDLELGKVKAKLSPVITLKV